VGKVLECLGRELQGKPRLAGAARADQGDDPLFPEQRPCLGELALPADERAPLDR